MSAFEYIALDDKGREQKGILEGDTARHVRSQLRDKGLTPIEVNAISERLSTLSQLIKPRRSRRITTADLALFTRQLATLLAAAMPLEEALLAVAEQYDKPAIKSILFAVRGSVLEGYSLATALRNFPAAFPNLYCATVGAGEQTGHLDTILARLADYVERQQQVRQKVQQALIYPSLMTLVSIGIVTFLLIFVVPKMIKVFANSGQTLPIMTQVLIALSHGIQHYGFYFLGLLTIAVIVFFRMLRNERFCFIWHNLLLKIPFIGYAMRIVNTARFARTFGILSQASVPVLEAMDIAAELISCLPIRKAVQAATLKVREGASIHFALKQTGYFLPMSIHLMASGEASSELEAMLQRAAENEENDVTSLINTSLSLFEPFMILGMGAAVLFIVLAVLLPIFSLNQIAT